MITVYHGGIAKVESPQAKAGRRNLDFGQGFYVTRRLDQAQEWAARTGRQQMEQPVVSEYLLDIEAIAVGSRYMNFEHYDSEWLHFIVACRQGYDPSLEYDCIEGGVANDRVIDTVEGYINGTVDETHALLELSRHQPNNQICLLNQSLIDKYLRFIKTI